MLHVNRCNGFTVAVSENKYLTPIAKRTILSEDALSPLIPVLEEIVGLADATSIRLLFEAHGLQIQEWDKVKTDWLTIRALPPLALRQAAGLQTSGAPAASATEVGNV